MQGTAVEPTAVGPGPAGRCVLAEEPDIGAVSSGANRDAGAGGNPRKGPHIRGRRREAVRVGSHAGPTWDPGGAPRSAICSLNPYDLGFCCAPWRIRTSAHGSGGRMALRRGSVPDLRWNRRLAGPFFQGFRVCSATEGKTGPGVPAVRFSSIQYLSASGVNRDSNQPDQVNCCKCLRYLLNPPEQSLLR